MTPETDEEEITVAEMSLKEVLEEIRIVLKRIEECLDREGL